MIAATLDSRSRSTAGLTVAAIGGLALVARLLFGAGTASYDQLWSLIWGRQLVHGSMPHLDALAIAPTPHPLANVVGGLASLFGQGGPAVLSGLALLSFGFLGVAAFRLGRELFSVWVGVGFALVLLTSAPLVDATLQGLVDVPFLALVLWAAALHAAGPHRGVGVFVALGLAGLLRPEAWLLAVVVVALRAPTATRQQIAGWGAAALAAPVIWLLFDLIATGDPFFSLHSTRVLGGLLGAPTGTGAALSEVPRSLRFQLAGPVIWAGLAGVLVGLTLLYRQTLMPAILLALGLAGFVMLGAVGLPLVYRYAFLPGAMVALLAVVGLLGWTALPAGRLRRRWTAVGVPATVCVVALSLSSVTGDLDRVVRHARRTAAVDGALRDVLARPGTPATLRGCGPVLTRDFLIAPAVAYRTGTDVATITLGPASRARSAVLARGDSRPGSWGAAALNARWAVYTRC